MEFSFINHLIDVNRKDQNESDHLACEDSAAEVLLASNPTKHQLNDTCDDTHSEQSKCFIPKNKRFKASDNEEALSMQSLDDFKDYWLMNQSFCYQPSQPQFNTPPPDVLENWCNEPSMSSFMGSINNSMPADSIKDPEESVVCGSGTMFYPSNAASMPSSVFETSPSSAHYYMVQSNGTMAASGSTAEPQCQYYYCSSNSMIIPVEAKYNYAQPAPQLHGTPNNSYDHYSMTTDIANRIGDATLNPQPTKFESKKSLINHQAAAAAAIDSEKSLQSKTDSYKPQSQISALTTATAQSAELRQPACGTFTATGEKIRRPPNAFMIFAKDRRREILYSNQKMTNKEVSKQLGCEWRLLALNQKIHYQKLSEQLRLEHQIKYPGYYYSPVEARRRKEEKRLKKAMDQEQQQRLFNMRQGWKRNSGPQQPKDTNSKNNNNNNNGNSIGQWIDCVSSSASSSSSTTSSSTTTDTSDHCGQFYNPK